MIFFVGYLVYMILTAIRFHRSNTEGWRRLHARTVYVKTALCVICFVDLALFAVFSQHWGRWHIQIAVCEWYVERGPFVQRIWVERGTR